MSSDNIKFVYIYFMSKRDVLLERAENMRKNPTTHERKFQDRLDVSGMPYRTQWVIGRYIVDFLVGKTIVEIDGDNHYEVMQAHYDKERTEYLNGLGYAVIRIRNRCVASFDMRRLSPKVKKSKKKKPVREKHIPLPIKKIQPRDEIRKKIQEHREVVDTFDAATQNSISNIEVKNKNKGFRIQYGNNVIYGTGKR